MDPPLWVGVYVIWAHHQWVPQNIVHIAVYPLTTGCVGNDLATMEARTTNRIIVGSETRQLLEVKKRDVITFSFFHLFPTGRVSVLSIPLHSTSLNISHRLAPNGTRLGKPLTLIINAVVLNNIMSRDTVLFTSFIAETLITNSCLSRQNSPTL